MRSSILHRFGWSLASINLDTRKLSIRIRNADHEQSNFFFLQLKPFSPFEWFASKVQISNVSNFMWTIFSSTAR